MSLYNTNKHPFSFLFFSTESENMENRLGNHALFVCMNYADHNSAILD